MSRRTAVICAVLLSFLMLSAMTTPAPAHLREQVGDLGIEIGWASEPTFAGEPNAVAFFVSEAAAEPAGDHTHAEGEEAGAPVPARQVTLTVEVLFGDKASTVKKAAVPLEPFQFGEPGEFRSEAFVPTRPGTYTFHVAGTIKGKAFDRFYTSGERGAIAGTEFDDVRELAAVSFPEKDETNGQLRDAVVNLRQTAARQVKDAKDDAKAARLFGIIGIAVGALGLVLSLKPRGKKAAS